MKTIASLLFCLFLLQTGFAQDAVVMKDSTRLSGKIIEITEDHVILKQSDTAVNKSTVEAYTIAYIVLQNGFTKRYTVEQVSLYDAAESNKERWRKDSLYYVHDQSISFNYLSFFNREINLIYAKDYRKKHLYLQIPVSFGFNYPKLTAKRYFQDLFIYTISHKIFDAGVGTYYIPSYKGKTNFLIGPLFKTQMYRGQQVLLPQTNQPLVIKESVLIRNSLSITTGMIIRSKSRLSTSAYISMGACYDVISKKIRRSTDNTKVNPIVKPLSFYFWAGFMVGYSF